MIIANRIDLIVDAPIQQAALDDGPPTVILVMSKTGEISISEKD
jgi:hypothetical protein